MSGNDIGKPKGVFIMGLIKVAVGSAMSVVHDQWKEYFYCDSIGNKQLMVKGVKKNTKNNKGSDNIITNGSILVVNEGQCAIIVDQGQIVEICAAPGEYTYDISTEPSVFSGGLGNGIKESFKTIGKRIGFAGGTAHDQRIYYFNLKEITDNTFGTVRPIPFRVYQDDQDRGFTVGVKCSGIYSYRVVDPIKLYVNLGGNKTMSYNTSDIDNQLFSEFISHLQQAFAKISSHIRYDELPNYNDDITKNMKEELTSAWRDTRGIEIQSVAIRTVSISEADESRIKKFEDLAWTRDPRNAAAIMVEAQSEAMKTAAANKGGAAMGFFGMNLAQQAGGMNAQNLFAMGTQAPPQNGETLPPAGSWKCNCGNTNTGKFCANCGKEKPNMGDPGWACSCGTANTGNFCASCGKPKPATVGWKCSCGTVNKGKFCSDCGKPKPAGELQYRCDKCGWEPDDPHHPPKFCAECGDPFGDEDIVK